MRTRIFLSWCHQDKALKVALLRDLLPALGVFTDLDVEWWEDSHLACGEELTSNIVDRLDETDFGLLLLVKFRTSCGLLCGLRERVEQWVDDFLREPFAG